MISAAITPGIQPHNVSIKTIKNDPQPLSTIAKGGKMMHNITLHNDIFLRLIYSKVKKRFIKNILNSLFYK